MTKPVIATFRIVTPPYGGGVYAGPHRPSVKRELRFWWRALAWARLQAETGSDDEALRLLRLREARIFGSIRHVRSQGTGVGEALFLLGICRDRDAASAGPEVDPWPGPRRLRAGTNYTLTLSFRRAVRATAAERQSLVDAIEAWGLFGGLGPQARRGFGSVTLLSLDGEDHRHDRPRYDARVQAVLARARRIQPSPYGALCADARFTLLATHGSVRAVQVHAGECYRAHRQHLARPPGLVRGLPLLGAPEPRLRPLHFHVHALWSSSAADPTEFVAVALYLPAFALRSAPASPIVSPRPSPTSHVEGHLVTNQRIP